LGQVFSPEVHESGWIGYPGATEAQITRTEDRLGAALPPSYRAFLMASNGWPLVGPFVGQFWPVDEVGRLADRRSNLVEDWIMGHEIFGGLEPVPDETYLVYGDEQDSALIRVEYLHSVVEISSFDTRDAAIYLLNPEILTPAGEWEAWHLASWLPGASRYRSFRELMQDVYRDMLDTRDDDGEYDQAFLDYVKNQIRPPQARVRKEVNLPGLLEALQREIESVGKQTASRPGIKATPLYNQALIEGLQLTQTRVREIDSQARDPEEARQRLRALADELDDLGRDGIRSVMKEFDVGRMLLAGLTGKIDEEIQSSGRPAGYRNAAAMIRFFLDQT
jgi:hypothetical protein